MKRYHMFCGNCFADLIVGVKHDQPGNGPFTYCPSCGQPTVARPEPVKDFWEVACEHFGTEDNPFPLQLLQMLYAEWPRIEYPRFADYIKAQMEAFDETGELLEA